MKNTSAIKVQTASQNKHNITDCEFWLDEPRQRCCKIADINTSGEFYINVASFNVARQL